MPTPNRKPELLAPAGDHTALKAAVLNGADAVYFGLPRFNARQRATNFSLEDLPETMRYLRAHNVRGYVALNTLIFSSELPEAARMVEQIAQAGADAVIVQDVGLAALVRRMAPSLPIHASTQMTLAHPRAIEMVKRWGIQRVILPRELSMDEIRLIRQKTDVELEVFVHGALCISFSGQCLASEALVGRSANRGECAQFCRLPYELALDGQPVAKGDRKYLLSPLDLAAYDLIGELTEIGIVGFKIEGRLKSAEYVAGVTQMYRAALDAALAKRAFQPAPQQKEDLRQSFSRGFTHGHLGGVDHQRLVEGISPKSRGVRVGVVREVTDRAVRIALDADAVLKPGDGVLFDMAHAGRDEQGGRIYHVDPRGPGIVDLEFGQDDVNLTAIAVASAVHKTGDPELAERMKHSFSRDRVAHPSLLSILVHARAGEALKVCADDDAGHRAEAQWEGPLQIAERHPLTLDLVREQSNRLGGTPFALGTVEAEALDPVMVPKSALNDLRRKVVDSLIAQREAAAHHTVTEPNALEALREEIRQSVLPAEQQKPQWYVLVRTRTQLDAVLQWTGTAEAAKPALIYCDFAGIADAQKVMELGRQAVVPIGLATPQVLKPGEEAILEKLLACTPDAMLVRNLAALSFLKEHAPGLPLIGDYALNAVNEISSWLLSGTSLARLTPGLDLNWQQLLDMAKWFPPNRLEAVLHLHVSLFHTQHCLAAANLTDARDHRSCGRACRRGQFTLRDRNRAVHPVFTDCAWRTTVFNAAAQSAAYRWMELTGAGIRHFRVELVAEDASQTKCILSAYHLLVQGTAEPTSVLRKLSSASPSDIVRGTWEPA